MFFCLIVQSFNCLIDVLGVCAEHKNVGAILVIALMLFVYKMFVLGFAQTHILFLS